MGIAYKDFINGDPAAVSDELWWDWFAKDSQLAPMAADLQTAARALERQLPTDLQVFAKENPSAGGGHTTARLMFNKAQGSEVVASLEVQYPSGRVALYQGPDWDNPSQRWHIDVTATPIGGPDDEYEDEYEDEEDGDELPEDLQERKLTGKERKKLPGKSFVFKKERKYPIHDKAHARNALARVSAHGTPSEKSRVRAAVKRKFPGIKVGESVSARSLINRLVGEGDGQPGYDVPPEGGLKAGDTVVFDMSAGSAGAADWGEDAEIVQQHDGQQAKVAAVAIDPEDGDKDTGYYDIEFGDGTLSQAVSGIHLTPVNSSPMAPKEDGGEGTLETMRAAVELLSDLNASLEYPGWINVDAAGTNFAFGDVNGPFGYDYGPIEDQGTREGGEEDIPNTSSPEELAAFVRRIVQQHSQGAKLGEPVEVGVNDSQQ